MTWELIILWVGLQNQMLSFHTGSYDSMVECFEVRDEIVERIGRPIINYQVVCVANDK